MRVSFQLFQDQDEAESIGQRVDRALNVGRSRGVRVLRWNVGGRIKPDFAPAIGAPQSHQRYPQGDALHPCPELPPLIVSS